MFKLTRNPRPRIHWHDNLLWCCSSYTERLLDGCWSPTRPSVFFVTREDGYMDAWDILYQQRSPVLSFKACIKTSTTSPFTTTFYGLWPWAIPQKFWCYDVKCECLKVSDTPLNAIKVMMRWISLSINPQLLYFLARFRVRATWWRWEAMTGTPACCSSAQASASAIGGSRVSSSRNNLDFLHSFRGKLPVPC